MATFKCSVCRKVKPVHMGGGTSYGSKGRKLCYACCGLRDRRAMIRDGRATLYLINPAGLLWSVGNWPGTLDFPVRSKQKGRHNIAGTRYDVWFNGPDGHVWHGVTYGDNTQLCHCKRTKRSVA